MERAYQDVKCHHIDDSYTQIDLVSLHHFSLHNYSYQVAHLQDQVLAAQVEEYPNGGKRVHSSRMQDTHRNGVGPYVNDSCAGLHPVSLHHLSLANGCNQNVCLCADLLSILSLGVHDGDSRILSLQQHYLSQ